MTPERIQELVNEHARLEYANDIDALTASIANQPIWE
jgi:hypothetical protein